MNFFTQIPLEENRAAWLKQRQLGIGGSDVAPILGLSKWRTPLDVYNDKTSDTLDDSDNTSMEWGRRLEPVIRQKYADVTGMPVVQPSAMFQSVLHPFMVANVDGIRADGVLVEIKTARSGADWGDEGTDQIPEYYLTQVQHYMAVLGADRCDVAVLIGGSDFRIYTVERDEEIIDMLIDEERKFWDLVVNRTPPAPRTAEEVAATFSSSQKEEREATADVADALVQMLRVQAQIKELKEQEDALKATVTGFMGEADTLTHDGATLATWKSTKPRVTFDSTSFKKAMPDIYERYLKQGESTRRFVIKQKLEDIEE